MTLGRVRLGSIRNRNNWNRASKRLFGSYSHSGIPGFPIRQFCSQEQNSRNIFRNIFLFWNIPNERAGAKHCYVILLHLSFYSEPIFLWLKAVFHVLCFYNEECTFVSLHSIGQFRIVQQQKNRVEVQGNNLHFPLF